MKTLAHINTCACFIIIKTWNNTCVYQQREKWTNKLWYIHTMEHYTAIEKRQTAASCNQMDNFHWHNDEQEKTGIMHTVWSCFIWSSKIGKMNLQWWKPEELIASEVLAWKKACRDLSGAVNVLCLHLGDDHLLKMCTP